MRLSDWLEDDIRIDLVGVDSTLGASSLPAPKRLPEVRLLVFARCDDAETAQIVEDEVYALSLSGLAGAGSIRCEKRPALAVCGRLHLARTRADGGPLGEGPMRVGSLCVGRSGDIGSTLDLTLVALNDEAYVLLEAQLTTARVQEVIGAVMPGVVTY